MEKISELKTILGKYLDWNKSRIDCFAQMLTALFVVRTVNLREMAVAMNGQVNLNSRYVRLKRFFRFFEMDLLVIAKWLFKWFFSESSKVYLTVDRTNWFWGKAKINILTVAVAYEGIAIPIFCQLLDKAGNATAQAHIVILQRFVETFGKACIVGILGDREFASGKLFGWCNKENIPYYIRIKDNAWIRIRDKKYCQAKKLFNDLNPKEQKPFLTAVEIYRKKVYLAGSRSERGALMIVASNQRPQNAIAIYLRRWEVESLFQSLKTRGFCFEDTHLTKPERIEKLMGLLAIGFCWAHKIGEWRAEMKPIYWNKHREGKRPQFSFFRYGLDWIRDAIMHWHIKEKYQEFKQCLRLLKVTEFIFQGAEP